ncbi:RNA degradosome polyphosphate kinase [Herbivorax sp. ANBcel31]|uniref:RNA degradosome polyphosphate kinase n=1 Tax=Herbivorax sp. ANBcel31 TaxID=3069754 RepID=UPI0027B7D55B|nr:RNA degradosome polyphosphate kinase [Herbivorax sp. ANBcel31]MDQ2086855.1 RNA degradosome polyphosphate kinase [Herbivorax sp. ANBcel31]
MKKFEYQLKRNYFNRELSWLEFNERVLNEACKGNSNPILERLKFLSIVSSNLDEFFMVRVASLFDQVLAGFKEPDIAGFTPREQINLISMRAHKMICDQYSCYNRSLVPCLKKEKIFLLKPKDLNEKQKDFIETFYYNTVYPVLTPMVVDRSRPFPLVLNQSLNIALLIENKEEGDEPIFGMVQVPSVLGRIIELPGEDDEKCFILLEDIIKMYIKTIFEGHNIITMACYRITRNTDQGLNEEEAEDLLEAIQQYIKKRKWGMVIRLEIEHGMAPDLLEILIREFEVPRETVYEINGPLDLTFLMKVHSIKGYDHLRYPVYLQQPVPELIDKEDIFSTISQKDILLHHPYQSFEPVIEFVKQAANDPDVLAIKQTLYRVSGNSPIVEALAQAAENGKQVTVLVELKARFDEQNNIIWAKRLEMAGCHVIYGLVGLKTHCKILLVVRKEEDGIKRYVHMSTGNYNDATAKIYTDLGLFTSNPYFGADASAVFNMLSGYSRLNRMYKLAVAPVTLRKRFKKLIRQEAENARNRKKAKIIANLNSLVDEGIINELYAASEAGVEIDLIVRGICCLRPGIKGLSERIRVKSIVGRFLEHRRIYYFHNDGEDLVYLSSADWMGRNLDRRVEILFPVEDSDISKRLIEILNTCMKDTQKGRMLDKNGGYVEVDKKEKEKLNCQEHFCKLAIKEAQKAVLEKAEKDLQ